jgi:hypothetical protein
MTEAEFRDAETRKTSRGLSPMDHHPMHGHTHQVGSFTPHIGIERQ